MKNIFLLAIVLIITSFKYNDAEKKTYWLCCCTVNCYDKEVAYAKIVEAISYGKAKIKFEQWVKSGAPDDRFINGVIAKETYTCRLITPESILK